MSHTLIKTLSPRQYKNNQHLSEITLSSSIKVIPRECFQGCKNLSKIIIPRSVRRIDFKAFANSGLEQVVFEEGSYLRVIATRCFAGCINLTAMSLPSTLLMIGSSSFEGCKALRYTISIPENVREIGALAFSDSQFSHLEFCSRTTRHVSDDYEKIMTLNIGYGAFQNWLKPPIKFTNLKHTKVNTSTDYDDVTKLSINRKIVNIGACAFQHSVITDKIATTLFNNCNVETIGQAAFAQVRNLGSITIPSSVKTIGKSAFSTSRFCLTYFTSIEFSQDSCLRSLPEGIFRGSHHFRVGKFPPSIRLIGKWAFSETRIDMETVSNLFSGGNIQYIDSYAFSNCKNLQSITIPSSVKSIGEAVFMDSELEEVVFSQDSQLQSIPDSTFKSCSSLKTVQLSGSVKSIGEYAFSYTGITDKSFEGIFENNHIQHIGSNAFLSCGNLGSITIPSSIQLIREAAFSLTSITHVEFSSSSQLKRLADSIFLDCRQLRVVKLPSSLEEIDGSAFHGTSIENRYLDEIFEKCNIQQIGRGAFLNCMNLDSLTIPSSVISIGDSAFESSSIRSFIFSPGSLLEIIPDSLFFQCTNLQTVRLPSSVKSIGRQAFAYSKINNESVMTILTSCNIEHIADEAFLQCKNFTSVSILSPIKSIGKSVFKSSSIESFECSQDLQLEIIPESIFAHCTNLKTVRLPPSVKSIQKCAFYRSMINDKSIAHIFTKCNIQHIGEFSFLGCQNVKSIIFPSTIKSIDKGAFKNSSLENIRFSRDLKLEAIPDSLFAFCCNLKTITLPSSVTSIGESAFSRSNITDIMLADIFANCNIQHIGDSAFSYCMNLRLIIIPTSLPLTSIGEHAFAGAPPIKFSKDYKASYQSMVAPLPSTKCVIN